MRDGPRRLLAYKLLVQTVHVDYSVSLLYSALYTNLSAWYNNDVMAYR